MSFERLRDFTCSVAITNGLPDAGVVAMGSPLGSDEFCARFMADAIAKSKSLLGAIATIPDAQTGFHMHHLCDDFGTCSPSPYCSSPADS